MSTTYRITRRLPVMGLAALALALAACGGGSSTAGSTGTANSSGSAGSTMSAQAGAASASTVQAEKTSLGSTLANGKGFTLYWFAADRPGKIACTGACATFWPPMIGAAKAKGSVPGTLGTEARPDGAKQATWDGHPLYTYKGDSKPGDTTGNGLNLNGGVWHAVVLSGAGVGPSTTPTSSSGGGGGYSY